MNMSAWILSCLATFGLTAGQGDGQDLRSLTLQEARETALRNHPLITVADLKVAAAREETKEVRSAYLPSISANAVAVGTAENNTRMAAIGALNNPSIFDRNAEGLMISQLITDFGRTANLTGSARLRAEAEANNAQATREQILLAVDGAFYSAAEAQSVTRVAQQTVAARQALLDQVTALASNKLRSDLDVSFAKVNLEEARLLLSKAQNDLQGSFAQLATLLGQREAQNYHLIEQPLPPGVSTNVSDYVRQALSHRPDLFSAREQQEAAVRFAKAERAARYPSVAAVGGAGVVPVHDPELPDHYAAAGVVVNVPLYAGGLYAARQRKAEVRAEAAAASVRDLEDNVIRDVRIAWLNARNAFDRYRITSQLLQNARQSFDLAQARYQNGLSSIVELNQAELSRVSAEISLASTQYEYLIQRSALNYQIGTAP
ncbi:MAG TPA: TolC family protein [Verrucomicrobiae bacterium]